MRIGGGSELDWVPDPSPSSNPGGVNFTDSSFESCSLMGGVGGFAFRFAGDRVKNGGGADRRGCGGGGAVGHYGVGGSGSALGAGRMSGCRGGGGPCAGSKVPNIGVG